MPSSLAELDISEQFQIQQNDPELYSLLAGTAPASLEAAVLSGAWADAPATPQQRQQAEHQQQVEAILQQGNPWGKPGYYQQLPNGEQEYVAPLPGNVTNQLLLQSLDPEKAAQLQLQATPVAPQPGQLDEAGATFVNNFLAGVR